MNPPSQVPFHSIRNETFGAVIHTQGAELKRLFHKPSGTDLLWQGDPDFWTGSAPILFPIVGRLKDRSYLWNGDRFTMTSHGLVRRATWETILHNESEARFRITSNPEFKTSYPFDWTLEAAFKLTPEGIRIDYLVTNTGSGDMFFSLGSHPAFNIPFAGGALEDYLIDFESTEDFACFRIVDEVLSPLAETIPTRHNTIPLTANLFDQDALIFKDIRSRTIRIRNTRNKSAIIVRTGGAPDLGVWAKPGGAPFVCIEPWFGYDDPADVSGFLHEKPGILTLPQGKSFEAYYELEFHP